MAEESKSEWITEFELCRRGIGYDGQAEGRKSGKLKAKQVGTNFVYRASDVDEWLLGKARAENAQRAASAPATAQRPMRYESLSAAQFAQRCESPATVSMSLTEAQQCVELLDQALALTPDRRDPVAMVDQLTAAIQKDTGCSAAKARCQVFKDHDQLRLDYVAEFNRRAKAR